MNRSLSRLAGLASLLKKNVSKGQLLGYSIANLVGLVIILSGILFYCDSRHHFKKGDKFFSEDYIVVSKSVKGVNFKPVAFSDKEVRELEGQPWVKTLGKFTPADFSVAASIEMGGRGLSSYLFFESVPDEFFDVLPQGWEFKPGDSFVPVVLNKDYLALYNFGFALPQGLPQLSEDMIGAVPLKLMLRGKNGRTQMMDAAVVGFSSRLNTIAVPQDFMDWANKYFSGGEEGEVSRLILKIDRLNPGNMESYMASKGYEIAGDKENESKISEFMGLVSGIVSATGVVISLLALFIMLLSISLLLQKSRRMIGYLFLLGYSPKSIGKYFQKRIIGLNLLITLLAVGLAFVCRLIWHKSLISLGLGNGNVLFMLAAAILYFMIVSSINIIVVRRHLLSIWSEGLLPPDKRP